jgi:hypothetical protein
MPLLLATISSTILDLIVLLANLVSFHRLDVMNGGFHGNGPPDLLMNFLIIHKVLSLLRAPHGEVAPHASLGSRNNGTNQASIQYSLTDWPW